MSFDRSFDPAHVAAYASSLEAAGLDQLWLVEDCFFTTAPPLAAAALAATTRLTVGIGILPAVVRTAALTAMELATLERMGPGRVVAGVGHGMQDWMAQMGVRPASPLGALEEVLAEVRALLAGERRSTDGAYVTLDDVGLQPPPVAAPPVLAGVRGPRSLELAGRCADGLVLAEWIGPTYVRRARAAAGDPQPFRVAAYSVLCVEDDARDARRQVVHRVAEQLEQGTQNVAAHPHLDGLRERLAADGEDGLVDAPDAWWHELGAVGTLDDAVTHVAQLHAAGADDVVLLPTADLDVARTQVAQAASIARAVR